MQPDRPLSVNVLGFGRMGRQICGLFHLLGFDLTVWTRSRAANNQQKLLLEARKIQRIAKLKAEAPGKYQFVGDPSELMPALTFEALIEDLSIKKAVISRLSYQFDERNLLTNTSSFRPDEIHGNAIGFHFFNPIHSIRLVECCVHGVKLLDETKEFVRKIEASGYETVPVMSNRGYIGNFLLFREIADVFRLIEVFGYSLGQIENEYRLLGRPFQVIDIVDLVGIDVTVEIIRNLTDGADSVYLPQTLLRALDEGILGRKNNTTIKSMLEKSS